MLLRATRATSSRFGLHPEHLAATSPALPEQLPLVAECWRLLAPGGRDLTSDLGRDTCWTGLRLHAGSAMCSTRAPAGSGNGMW